MAHQVQVRHQGRGHARQDRGPSGEHRRDRDPPCRDVVEAAILARRGDSGSVEMCATSSITTKPLTPADTRPSKERYQYGPQQGPPHCSTSRNELHALLPRRPGRALA